MQYTESQNFALGAAAMRPGLSDRIGRMNGEASETLQLLRAQHERLFGMAPSVPTNIGAAPKSDRPPTLDEVVDALSDKIADISHLTRCLADRI